MVSGWGGYVSRSWVRTCGWIGMLCWQMQLYIVWGNYFVRSGWVGRLVSVSLLFDGAYCALYRGRGRAPPSTGDTGAAARCITAWSAYSRSQSGTGVMCIRRRMTRRRPRGGPGHVVSSAKSAQRKDVAAALHADVGFGPVTPSGWGTTSP